MDYDSPAYNQVHTCKLCPLNEVRLIATPAQPGASYTQGGLAVMVETAREDDSGIPINGPRVRKLFDKMLERAGTSRAEVLTMVRVRCAPPRGRVRDHEDAQIMCDVNTQGELATYNPAVVLLMGGTTIEPIYGKKAGVAATRGTIAAKGAKHAWGARMYVATYHPAAALVEKHLEQTIVEDLRLAVSLA